MTTHADGDSRSKPEPCDAGRGLEEGCRREQTTKEPRCANGGFREGHYDWLPRDARRSKRWQVGCMIGGLDEGRRD